MELHTTSGVLAGTLRADLGSRRFHSISRNFSDGRGRDEDFSSPLEMKEAAN
jgi:hypothetical protein